MMVTKPPMGWNSWNTFGMNINEELIREMADVMANEGYLEAGYDTLVIDDGWQADFRSADGHLQADPIRFPSGIKPVADYVHSKGLKFGIYSAAGVKSCGNKPGSFGHEFTDARDFADWGVDYLKYDLCHFPGCGNKKSAYLTMSMALKTVDREIVYSGAICGEEEPGTWMRSIGANLYRSTGDIQDSFESIRRIAISQRDKLCESAPGCYNDPDMLVIGMRGEGYAANGGCTDDEYLIHFGIWCMYSVPLMIGADLRKIDPFCKQLLLKKELIAINQDPECRPPYFEKNSRYSHDQRMVLFKMLADNQFALGFFNLTDAESKMQVYMSDIGLPTHSDKGLHLVDIISGEDLGVHKDFFSPILQKHTCRIFKATIE